MGSDHPVVHYWPAAVGVVLAGFAVWLLSPTGDQAVDDGPQDQPIAIPQTPSSEVVPRESEPARKERNPFADPPLDGGRRSPPPPRVEYREVVRAVHRDIPPLPKKRTYDQDDPEVRKALDQVDIQIYAPKEDESARHVEAFFNQNQLRFETHDLSDAMNKERARRLGGTRQGVTLVVDGEVLAGVDRSEIQEALKNAVKKRIEAP